MFLCLIDLDHVTIVGVTVMCLCSGSIKSWAVMIKTVDTWHLISVTLSSGPWPGGCQCDSWLVKRLSCTVSLLSRIAFRCCWTQEQRLNKTIQWWSDVYFSWESFLQKIKRYTEDYINNPRIYVDVHNVMLCKHKASVFKWYYAYLILHKRYLMNTLNRGRKQKQIAKTLLAMTGF